MSRGATSTHRGFILQPTYRVESGRPVVHLYGRLEDGRPFLVRDSRAVPHFYVASDDAVRARDHGARPLAATDLATLDGRPVVRIDVPTVVDDKQKALYEQLAETSNFNPRAQLERENAP